MVLTTSFDGSQAAFDNDTATIKDLHKYGVSVNVQDYDGRSPLHLAASTGHADVVKLLLELGADIGIKDRFGGRPLDDATRERRYDCMKVRGASGRH